MWRSVCGRAVTIIVVLLMMVIMTLGVAATRQHSLEKVAFDTYQEEFVEYSLAVQSYVEERPAAHKLLDECDEAGADQKVCDQLSQSLTRPIPQVGPLPVDHGQRFVEQQTHNIVDYTLILQQQKNQLLKLSDAVDQSMTNDSSSKVDTALLELSSQIQVGESTFGSSEILAGEKSRQDLRDCLDSAIALSQTPPEHQRDKLDEYTKKLSDARQTIVGQVGVVEDAVAEASVSDTTVDPLPAHQADTADQSRMDSSNTGEEQPTYTLYASTCSDADQGQACVDSTSVTYIDFSPWDGPQWVGGHRGGEAGVILNFNPGDVVTVVGSAAAGTYQITGAQWVPKTHGIDVSTVGQGFAFQTCSDTQMRIVWATRI